MSAETKILGGILIGSFALMIGLVLIFSNKSNDLQQNGENQVYAIDYSKGQKIGSDSAKVKLVEFSDFQCPACKGYEPHVKDLRETYKDDLQLIYKHFPLPQHKNAEAAANFSEYAATQGKFWEVHDALFETQQEWESLNDPKDFFVGIGKSLGLNEQQIIEAIEKKLFKGKINEDVAEGRSIQVNATPTFYLNGQKLKMQNFMDLKNAVEQELKK